MHRLYKRTFYGQIIDMGVERKLTFTFNIYKVIQMNHDNELTMQNFLH